MASLPELVGSTIIELIEFFIVMFWMDAMSLLERFLVIEESIAMHKPRKYNRKLLSPLF